MSKIVDIKGNKVKKDGADMEGELRREVGKYINSHTKQMREFLDKRGANWQHISIMQAVDGSDDWSVFLMRNSHLDVLLALGCVDKLREYLLGKLDEFSQGQQGKTT